MEKVIVIRGKATEVNKIIQENRIRKEMGLISIKEGRPKSPEKREYPEKREKKSPVMDNKNV
ncbi:MAG: hypothetical protein E7K32_07785 [Bacteroides stercoris]|jgi:hypothetical protein|nr:hypothetical protein [Bacteroides stercoris]